MRRLLPQADRRAIGPFVFFDHFGPIDVAPEARHDVRPHPHIGLSTLTYLFEGAIVHRDSTGIVQRIEPGAVNLMMAGRGIVHSERTPEDLLGRPRRSHGLQLWIALPEADEESAPSFQHVAAARLPEVRLEAATARIVVGSAFGASSPVQTRSPTFAVILDFDVAGGASLELPAFASERALYAIDGPVEVDGDKTEAFTMLVLPAGSTPRIAVPHGGRVVVIGGEPLGPRFLSWNFVSSRVERIRAAEHDWRAQRFERIPGETEFIPLPERHS